MHCAECPENIRIVPEWNVKYIWLKWADLARVHQNRTRVECKELNLAIFIGKKGIRIVPEWNVKKL